MLLGLRFAKSIQANEEHRAQTDQLEAALKSEGYNFTITPVALPERTTGGGAQGRPDEGTGTRDSFRLAERVSGIFGKEVISYMAIGLGLLLGADIFIAAAVLGERNALWIPGVVLIAAAVGSLVA